MDTAFCIASKIARIFIDPGTVLFVLLMAGTVLVWVNWLRWAKVFLSLGCALALFAFLVPTGGYTAMFLENRFPANPMLPDKIDGIVVLGGVVDANISHAREITSVNGSVERLMAFADLANRYPNAEHVFTSGSGNLFDQTLKEADFVAPILQKLGMNVKNITFENQSRNTYENAVYSFDLVQPQPSETWILITSAAHMPRAMGVFRMAKWPNVIAYPVDFGTIIGNTPNPPLNLRSGLKGLARTLVEIAGLTAYYVTGKTDALIPAP